MYVTPEGLDNLKHYKYAGVDKSILVQLFFRRHWDYCIEFIPRWVAPNLVTVTGFMILLTAYALLVYYCPNLNGQAPNWFYLYAAFTVYLYQLLDNLDGRQARRTNSSSPLGELFDHGCDSLFVTFAGSFVMNCLQFSPWQFWVGFFVTAIPFFAAHWEEYHTGSLILGVIGNPTEGQCVIMLFLISTVIAGGPKIWLMYLSEVIGPTFLPDFRLNTIALASVGFGAVSMFIVNVRVILNDAHTLPDGNRGAVWSIRLIVPFSSAAAMSTLWFYWSPDDILGNQTTLALIWIGFTFSYCLTRMLISRVTMMTYNIFNPVPYLSVFGLINLLLPVPLIEDALLFWILLGVLLLAYAHFVVTVINQFTNHLGIYVFRLKHNQGSPLLV
eukprot:TRINITY_DN6235_c0_g1_i1.p1 TRINITY_DN6235_c0_g1~~TRINITY_DN6235_c0_g1_i1.p1  ORF type:complete len:386 (-),score=29.71 TRINITY_DN6235_c0_g1_i1:11-1168(-)